MILLIKALRIAIIHQARICKMLVCILSWSFLSCTPGDFGKNPTKKDELVIALESLGELPESNPNPTPDRKMEKEEAIDTDSERTVLQGEESRGFRESRNIGRKRNQKEGDLDSASQYPQLASASLGFKKAKTGTSLAGEQPIEKHVMDKYKSFTAEQLAELAKNNDIPVQEFLVEQCLETGLSSLIKDLINPFQWQGIQERCEEDERYVFLLLSCKARSQEEAELYTKISTSVIQHAQAGHVLAQHNLGLMYDKGKGVLGDYKQALEYYMKAAEQEYAWSQHNLGLMYFQRRGMSPNYEQALTWFHKAAQQGFTRAQDMLGKMYYAGKGVPQDYNQAFKWVSKVASHESTTLLADHLSSAQNMVGSMYYDGKAGIQDYEQAFKWFHEAASRGHSEAQNSLGFMYKEGKFVKQDYQQAFHWFSKSASKGFVGGEYNLACMYQEGKFVPQDHNQAFDWFSKAASQGYNHAQSMLANMYYNGLGVEARLDQAVCWYKKAKAKAALLNIFSITPVSSISNNQATEESLNKLRDKLLGKWQSIIVQKSRDREGKCATSVLSSYTKLEETALELMKWQLKLRTESGFMLSCIHFKDMNHISSIYAYQARTGNIPYVKQYGLLNKEYTSFGEDNVKLADRIVAELTFNPALYQGAQSTLARLRETYEKAKIQADSQALYIEEKCQRLALDESKKGALLKKLALENELSAIFEQKLQEIQEETDQFTNYYNLVLAQIEQEVSSRNQKFQKENAYLFE
jgi:TPR repeat protein